jgi:hypothetical protein
MEPITDNFHPVQFQTRTQCRVQQLLNMLRISARQLMTQTFLPSELPNENLDAVAMSESTIDAETI